MVTSIFNFLCWVVFTALLVKFLRTLAEKWGILEYLQAHAPNEFLYKLFSCEFCQSFWLGTCLGILLGIFVDWHLIFVGIFSCNLR